MIKFARTATAMFALSTLTAGAVSAATVTADYSRGNGASVEIVESSRGSFDRFYAGSFILDPKTPGEMADDFIAFCVDIADSIANGVTYQTSSLASSGFTATVRSNIERLYSTYYAGLGDDNSQNAAFQIALWEIVDDNEANALDLGSGLFQTGSSAITDLAQDMLDNLGEVTDEWRLTFFDAGPKQDQIVGEAGGGATVPLPAGLPLIMTAAGGLLLARRKRKAA